MGCQFSEMTNENYWETRTHKNMEEGNCINDWRILVKNEKGNQKWESINFNDWVVLANRDWNINSGKWENKQAVNAAEALTTELNTQNNEKKRLQRCKLKLITKLHAYKTTRYTNFLFSMKEDIFWSKNIHTNSKRVEESKRAREQ